VASQFAVDELAPLGHGRFLWLIVWPSFPQVLCGKEGIEETGPTSSPLVARGHEIVKVQGVLLYEGLHWS